MSLDVSLVIIKPTEVYDRNITHNLGGMAEAAGIYQHLWRPEEIGIHSAYQLIGPLTVGLGKLLENPDSFKEYEPANKWGKYENLVKFVTSYLEACQENPEAVIKVSR